MTRIGSRTTGRPTLAEVARLSGVSPITASRALRGVATVAPDLVLKVQEAALALGYVANPAARALASAKSHSVVVLVPSLSNHLFIDTLEAIHDVLHPRGLEMLIGNFHYDMNEEEALLRQYLAYPPAGLLITGSERSDASRQLLAGCGVPHVQMMELPEQGEVYSVGFSQHQAGRAAAEHLLGRGCKRIGFVAAQLDLRVRQRCEGFRQALAEAGLDDPRLHALTPEPSSIGLGTELFRELFAAHPDIDGLFFCNDDLAQGAIYEAARQHIAVPGQVAMIGFNDLPASAHLVPRLSSIRTPRAAIGQAAAQMLLNLIDGKAVEQTTLDLGFELMVRES